MYYSTAIIIDNSRNAIYVYIYLHTHARVRAYIYTYTNINASFYPNDTS